LYQELHVTVSLFAEDAASKASLVDIDVYHTSLKHNHHAITESNTSGMCKILCKKGTDEIVNAMNVACFSSWQALINEVMLAMKHGTGLGGIGCNFHGMWTSVY
jgi:pyruvate/2-oxoglutarate dehydrogenase complex dihydrolipoamide dehydrogenase (E3) component